MPGTTPIYGFRYQLGADAPDGPNLGLQGFTDVENALRDRFTPLVSQMTAASAALSTTTLTAVATVTLPLAGSYSWEIQGVGQQLTAAGRPAFALGGTSTATAWRWTSAFGGYNAAAPQQGFVGNGTTYPGATAGTALVNTDLSTSSGYSWFAIKGTVTVSAAGTLTARFSETVGGNWTVREGTIFEVRRYA